MARLEIGTHKDKIIRYGEYSFACRLFVDVDRDLAAIEWLEKNYALIICTGFESPYFKIIFASNNWNIIQAIHRKYGCYKVDFKSIKEEIYNFERLLDADEREQMNEFYQTEERMEPNDRRHEEESLYSYWSVLSQNIFIWECKEDS